MGRNPGNADYALGNSTRKNRMRLIAITVLFIISVSTPSRAFDTWDRTEKGLLIASTVAMVVDWRQTVYIANHPGRYWECNPILGRHPSEREVNLYFVGAVIGKIIVAHILPSKWRKIWLTGMMVVSVGCVGNNLRAGIGMKW